MQHSTRPLSECRGRAFRPGPLNQGVGEFEVTVRPQFATVALRRLEPGTSTVLGNLGNLGNLGGFEWKFWRRLRRLSGCSSNRLSESLLCRTAWKPGVSGVVCCAGIPCALWERQEPAPVGLTHLFESDDFHLLSGAPELFSAGNLLCRTAWKPGVSGVVCCAGIPCALWERQEPAPVGLPTSLKATIFICSLALQSCFC